MKKNIELMDGALQLNEIYGHKTARFLNYFRQTSWPAGHSLVENLRL